MMGNTVAANVPKHKKKLIYSNRMGFVSSLFFIHTKLILIISQIEVADRDIYLVLEVERIEHRFARQLPNEKRSRNHLS